MTDHADLVRRLRSTDVRTWTAPDILMREAADMIERLAAPAPEPVAYCPAYELERLKAGHSASVRSSRFGPSQLDGDVPLYAHPAAPAPDAATVKDAARYRWLRDTPWYSYPGLDQIISQHRNTLWDAAIDQAMKEKP